MANKRFSPKSILKREMQARGWRTNGASREDLWRDATLDLRRWCVKTASQAVVSKVAEKLAERDEDRALTLLKNPPFTDHVYQGKYETFVGEPPSRSRNRVRPIYGMSEVRSELLENQLLKHNIDPQMPRAQQVQTILRLDAEVTAKMDTEDNSYADSSIPDERNNGVLDTLHSRFRAAFGAFMGAFCCCFRPRCYWCSRHDETIMDTYIHTQTHACIHTHT